jgi:phosphomannomutase
LSIRPEIFKAYDIRGIFPTELDEAAARSIGQAYAAAFRPSSVAVGADSRPSSPALKAAVVEGLTSRGVEVVDIGTITTDMLYFTVGKYGYGGGVQVTASHNPEHHNGFKFIGPGVQALGEAELSQIRDAVGKNEAPSERGEVRTRVVTEEYLDHVTSFIDTTKLRPLSVWVKNPSPPLEQNLQALVSRLPLQRAQTLSEADLSVSWDLDADRCRFVAPDGEEISGYFVAALLAGRLLEGRPGEKVIHDPRLVWAIEESVERSGGIAIQERAGHSFIKARMRSEDALFAGEMSGHYYFRDNFYADNGLIPFLLVWELISETGETLPELLRPLTDRYFISGERSFEIPDPAQALQRARDRFNDGEVDQTDGLGVSYETWRFNVRPSNTEPLLRLNVESRRSRSELERRVWELEELIRG